MIELKELSEHIQNTLNNNTSGFTFKLHNDTGVYNEAVRSAIDYNEVTQIINGVATITSTENSPTNDGRVIASMVVRCDFAIPLRDTEQDVYQATELNPEGELVKTGNINYLSALRSLFDKFASQQIITTIEDSNNNSYSVTAAFSYAESGTRAQRYGIGDSLTFVVYGYYNIIQNGENSRNYAFILDGQFIPYRSATLGRRPVSEADVYNGSKNGVAKSTSTASQLYVSLEVPAIVDRFNEAVKDYVLEGENNTVHLLTIKAGDKTKSYLVMFGDSFYNASGILNVGGTVSLVEAVDDYELVEIGKQLTVERVTPAQSMTLVYEETAYHAAWVPGVGIYGEYSDNLVIDASSGIIVYTGLLKAKE